MTYSEAYREACRLRELWLALAMAGASYEVRQTAFEEYTAAMDAALRIGGYLD